MIHLPVELPCRCCTTTGCRWCTGAGCCIGGAQGTAGRTAGRMEIGGVLLRWISSREDVERLVRSVGGDVAILKVRGMVVAGCV